MSTFKLEYYTPNYAHIYTSPRWPFLPKSVSVCSYTHLRYHKCSLLSVCAIMWEHPNIHTQIQPLVSIRYQNEYFRKTTGYISFKISILVFDILTVLKKGYFFLSLPLKVMWKYHHRTPLCWAEKWRRVHYTLERKVKGLWGECLLIQQNKRDCN